MYDFKDIDVKFTLNLPNNDYEMAQIISLLSDKVSIKGMTEKLSWITNADKDFKDMLEEKKQVQENTAPPKLNFNDTSNITDNADNVGDKNEKIKK
jgi:hypothetical protein